MKLVLTSLLLACAVVPLPAATVGWFANLNAAQENNPANTSTATGYGTVWYDDASNVLSLNLTWSGLTGEGMQAHIHCCAANALSNAGIALDLWLMPDPRPASGTYSAVYDLDVVNPFRTTFTSANGGTTMTAFAALRSAMDADNGRSYYNIHTMAFPGGEIRGNLAPIPEPATLMTFLIGSAVLGLTSRRRRKRSI